MGGPIVPEPLVAAPSVAYDADGDPIAVYDLDDELIVEAGDLIDRLTLQYNRARQESITSELLEGSSGAEALDLVAHTPMDAVVSDMRMPNMDGAHLLTLVRAIQPDSLRIVLAGAVLSLYFALIGLAVSSLTSRRAFAMGGYVALMIVSQLVSGFLRFGVDAGDWASLRTLIDETPDMLAVVDQEAKPDRGMKQ